MTWELNGTYFENCSCDSFCPCASSGFGQPADQDYCHLVLVFHVDSGQIEGVDVGGHTVALVVDSPKMMIEGNWSVGLFIDDSASDEQADALGSVFGGQAGGPLGALAPLIGEVLGVERAPITYASDGLTHSVKIGDAMDVEVQDIVQQGSEEPVRIQNMTMAPVPDVAVATAARASINAFGLDWDNTGQHASTGPYSWSG
jgi:hypothetical protein